MFLQRSQEGLELISGGHVELLHDAWQTGIG
jgi:hypothetical protein